MVNLCTERVRKGVSRRYVRSVAMVVSTAALIVSFLCTAFLLPAYIVASSAVREGGEYLRAATELATLREKRGSIDELRRSTARATAVQASIGEAPYAALLATLSEQVTPGIRLTSISATAAPEQAVLVTVEGVAATRASLVTYTTLLKERPEVSSLSFPVSSLIEERNATFTISFRWQAKAL